MDHHTKCPHCGQLIGAQPITETCPDCYGRGFVTDFRSSAQFSSYMQRPCPRGCPPQYTVNLTGVA